MDRLSAKDLKNEIRNVRAPLWVKSSKTRTIPTYKRIPSGFGLGPPVQESTGYAKGYDPRINRWIKGKQWATWRKKHFGLSCKWNDPPCRLVNNNNPILPRPQSLSARRHYGAIIANSQLAFAP